MIMITGLLFNFCMLVIKGMEPKNNEPKATIHNLVELKQRLMLTKKNNNENKKKYLQSLLNQKNASLLEKQEYQMPEKKEYQDS